MAVRESSEQATRNEKGIALVTALLTLLVLSTLSAGLIFVTQSGNWSTANYKSLTQARFQAEAGAQDALRWFRYNYTPATGAAYSTTTNPVQLNNQNVVLAGSATSNYPTPAMVTSFNDLQNKPLTVDGVTYNIKAVSGTYSVSATLLRVNGVVETWKLVSQGNIPGVRASTVQTEMVIENGGTPMFQWAFYGTGTGCGNVTFGGSGGGTDSFDSTQGGWPSSVLQTDGDVGSNGNIFLKSANDVGGVAYTPWTDTNTGNCDNATNPDGVSLCGPSCIVTEGVQKLTAPTTFLPPQMPTLATPPQNIKAVDLRNSCGSTPGCTYAGIDPITGKGIYSLVPGTYNNILLGGGSTLRVSAGTYNINSIDMTGGSIMRVQSGPVIVNVFGTGITGSDQVINFGGGGLANDTQNPSNLIFYYAGAQPIDLSGGSGSYGLLYAPNAPVTMGGGGDWWGAAIGKSLLMTGGSSLHYDRSLGTSTSYLIPSPFRPISISRSRY